MNYHKEHDRFEMSTCGNVLAEVLKEVARAREELEAGRVSGAAVSLEYIDTIIEDACSQYGSGAVFGISKLQFKARNNPHELLKVETGKPV